MAEAGQRSPINFDVYDLNFVRDMLEWSQQALSEMRQTIMATHEMIGTSKALMAEADRILAWK